MRTNLSRQAGGCLGVRARPGIHGHEHTLEVLGDIFQGLKPYTLRKC